MFIISLQALNPNEIQRALIQCKEQTRDKLERACLAVESAAKSGGVYPDVLFDVAKRWYELYEESAAGGRHKTVAASSTSAAAAANVVLAADDAAQALVPAVSVAADGQEVQPLMQLLPPQQLPTQAVVPLQAAQGQLSAAAALAIGHVPAQAAYQLPGSNPHTSMPHHPYIAPYSYVQAMQPNYAHHYSAPAIPLHTHNVHPSYMASYPYQNPTAGFINVNIPSGQNTTIYHANISHLRPPQLQLFMSNQQAAVAAAAQAQAAAGQRLQLVQHPGQQQHHQQLSAVQQQQAVAASLEQQAHHASVSQTPAAAAALVVQPGAAAVQLQAAAAVPGAAQQQPVMGLHAANQHGLSQGHAIDTHSAQQVQYLQVCYFH